MAAKYSPRKVIFEGNAQQKSFLFQDQMMRGLRSLGARWEVYQSVTGTGARSRSANYDITTVGGLFDEGLVTLPYGGTYDQQERVDAYITQLCQWRTDEGGNSIKFLTRDMVMATLFAESEAFVEANRRREAPIQKNRSRAAPLWSSKKKRVYRNEIFDNAPAI
jgi:hypothetical protein